MNEMIWENSFALIAMLASISFILASISIGTSSDSTEDLETDLDNPEDAERPEENQQKSLAKPERRLMSSAPQQGGLSLNLRSPFKRRKRRNGSH